MPGKTPTNKPLFHTQSAEDVLKALEVEPERGLSEQQVAARREQYGSNQLREAKQRSLRDILLDQFKSIVVALLAVAGTTAFAFGEIVEGVAIFAVILINGVIGFFSEWKAIRSMEALKKIVDDTSRVRREGKELEIPVEELVPGDIVPIESGDIVPADVRLLEANNLRVAEAVLTGESVPVRKRLEPVEADAALADRDNMLFKGTTVAEGTAMGVVAATGMQTELGKISEMVEQAEDEATPLEKRLDYLGRLLAWITIGIAIVVAISGLLAGQPPVLMIETAIALGVAAIPEGLPIVATIALARGMWIMAKRQALINRLTAVETLGATHVICTDKTGTLTENRMTVTRIITPTGEHKLRDKPDNHDPLLARVLEIGMLCSNAALSDAPEDGGQGDPTEVALLRAGQALGLTRAQLLDQKPEVREEPFHAEKMMMATFHQTEAGFEVAVKGAPRAVLEACDLIAGDADDDAALDEKIREEWLEKSEKLAGEGLRLLAVADKQTSDQDAQPYQGLRFVGLACLHDPPRDDVRSAIDACRSAGIRVVMVTGDQPATARAIACQVGLVDDPEAPVIHGREMPGMDDLSEDDRRRVLQTNIFARFNPEQKLRLVDILQDNGDTVAMTGDGVNDTPALKKADIGIAMGKRGTDAARQVADMVLKDDAFSSIVAAVEQGRIIFGNIRKSVMFMLCTNVAEILAVALASLAGAPLPLLPLQILYLNILTDAWPALALGVGEGDPGVMKKPPRSRDETVLTRGHWQAIGGWSIAIAACVLGALTLALQWAGMEQEKAVTVSFLTLGFTKLWFVFNLRDSGSTLFTNDIVRNPWIWISIGLCILLLVGAVYLPGLSAVLNTQPLGTAGWGLVLSLSLLPMLAGQALRAFQRQTGRGLKQAEA